MNSIGSIAQVALIRRAIDNWEITEYTSDNMKSSIPEDSRVLLIAIVILAVIGTGVVIDWLHWPGWLVAVPAVIGAIVTWLSLREEE